MFVSVPLDTVIVPDNAVVLRQSVSCMTYDMPLNYVTITSIETTADSSSGQVTINLEPSDPANTATTDSTCTATGGRLLLDAYIEDMTATLPDGSKVVTQVNIKNGKRALQGSATAMSASMIRLRAFMNVRVPVTSALVRANPARAQLLPAYFAYAQEVQGNITRGLSLLTTQNQAVINTLLKDTRVSAFAALLAQYVVRTTGNPGAANPVVPGGLPQALTNYIEPTSDMAVILIVPSPQPGTTQFIIPSRTPSASKTPSASSAMIINGGDSSSSNTGAIIGGVLGGVAGLILIVGGFLLFTRNRKASKEKELQQRQVGIRRKRGEPSVTAAGGAASGFIGATSMQQQMAAAASARNFAPVDTTAALQLRSPRAAPGMGSLGGGASARGGLGASSAGSVIGAQGVRMGMGATAAAALDPRMTNPMLRTSQRNNGLYGGGSTMDISLPSEANMQYQNSLVARTPRAATSNNVVSPLGSGRRLAAAQNPPVNSDAQQSLPQQLSYYVSNGGPISNYEEEANMNAAAIASRSRSPRRQMADILPSPTIGRNTSRRARQMASNAEYGLEGPDSYIGIGGQQFDDGASSVAGSSSVPGLVPGSTPLQRRRASAMQMQQGNAAGQMVAGNRRTRRAPEAMMAEAEEAALMAGGDSSANGRFAVAQTPIISGSAAGIMALSPTPVLPGRANVRGGMTRRMSAAAAAAAEVAMPTDDRESTAREAFGLVAAPTPGRGARRGAGAATPTGYAPDVTAPGTAGVSPRRASRAGRGSATGGMGLDADAAEATRIIMGSPQQ